MIDSGLQVESDKTDENDDDNNISIHDTTKYPFLSLSTDRDLSLHLKDDHDTSPHTPYLYPRLFAMMLPESVISSHWFEKFIRAMCTNFFPDEPQHTMAKTLPVPLLEEDANNVDLNDTEPQRVLSPWFMRLFESSSSIKLFKFFVVTICFIVTTYHIVRWCDFEHDEEYSMSDFILYDFNLVTLDIISFFVVGRLFERNGVDVVHPFLFPMAMGCLFPSVSAELWFMQHSFSMYEVMCRWPWELFLFVFLAVFLGGALAVSHLKYAYKLRILPSRLVEACLLTSMLILPYASNPNFHFHHWYASWMLGMHSNLPSWWSKATLAFLWGQYMNGVAVWGRDPILTCAYSFQISTNLQCPYMQCYTIPSNSTDDVIDDDTPDNYADFVAPSWHNCSAEGNYIP